MKSKYNYDWTLKDAVFTKDKGNVFSCFACGGGSTMGYKLAGFDVLGCNEIDPRMAECYKVNHNPKYCFIEPIQEFKNRTDLPDELFNLDILDGSPPCSSFSTTGLREAAWGVEKKFREGQKKQVLDTLFFDFIDLGKRLQPKIIIAENVKGLLIGNARKYLYAILDAFYNAGYFVTYSLLNSRYMGVPQKRERVFFFAIRKDLYKNEFIDIFQSESFIDMQFDYDEICFSEISDNNDLSCDLTELTTSYWVNAKQCESVGKYDARRKQSMNDVCFTTCASHKNYHPTICRQLNNDEIIKIQTFPSDYNFISNSKSHVNYMCGMSVPPVMMANIADRVYSEWLSKI